MTVAVVASLALTGCTSLRENPLAAKTTLTGAEFKGLYRASVAEVSGFTCTERSEPAAGDVRIALRVSNFDIADPSLATYKRTVTRNGETRSSYWGNQQHFVEGAQGRFASGKAAFTPEEWIDTSFAWLDDSAQFKVTPSGDTNILTADMTNAATRVSFARLLPSEAALAKPAPGEAAYPYPNNPTALLTGLGPRLTLTGSFTFTSSGHFAATRVTSNAASISTLPLRTTYALSCGNYNRIKSISLPGTGDLETIYG
ncbi:hypothetical protein JT358_15595 [Micrococcales bacterium 31B]|nr:hypothetical protein [Micrococcales bacterium 31B]